MRFPWLRNPRVRGNILVGLLAFLGFFFALALGAWTRACAGEACPSIASLNPDVFSPEQASKVYAADGRLITDFGLERRTVVPLEQMAPAVKAAFVVTEDKRFYRHHGVDYFRVIGAVKNNILEMRFAEGFSTITMQLARNLWPENISGRDRSPRRKIREAQVAFEIEQNYSKDRILELYLNQIGLGNGAYGVESASQRYFGKSVRDVNVAEAALLAALPKAPSSYNPRRYPRRAVMRRNVVINLLRDGGYLTEVEAEKWKAYPLILSSRSDFSDVAPYFVEYVRQVMDAQFGSGLYRQGLRIYTTIDLDLQQAAERAHDGAHGAGFAAAGHEAGGHQAHTRHVPQPGRASGRAGFGRGGAGAQPGAGREAGAGALARRRGRTDLRAARRRSALALRQARPSERVPGARGRTQHRRLGAGPRDSGGQAGDVRRPDGAGPRLARRQCAPFDGGRLTDARPRPIFTS